MKNINFLLIVLIIISCQSKKTQSTQTQPQPLGQTAPSDMIFLPGDETMAGFYLAKTEEPNINYHIYLNYLQKVYGDVYPEVVEAAMPKPRKKKIAFSDPYLTEYFTHPAFSYYPVTNLSWEQIDNYLLWKTDRLNEAILIDTDILNFSSEQIAEDSFNSEAHLLGQYEGMMKNLIKEPSGKERLPATKDGILHTGFRLPTAAEWDYAHQSSYNKNKNVLKKGKAVLRPFGDKYYLNKWENFSSDFAPPSETEPLIDYKSYFKNYSERDPEDSGPRAKSVPPFSSPEFYYKNNAFLNMDDSVREWVINDEAADDSKEKDWIKVYKNAGFTFNDPVNKNDLDEDYEYYEKDSTGRMHSFRFVGTDEKGEPYELSRYSRMSHEFAVTKKIIQEYEDHLNLKKEDSSFNSWLGDSEESLRKEIDILKNKIKKLQVEQNNYRPKKRLVKGGAGNVPGNFTKAFPEDKGYNEVGFRVVLPYSPKPVLNGYQY